MPLFFMISGYCIGIKNNFAETKFCLELKKVFFRLILPYLIWSLLYIILADKLMSPTRYIATLTLRGLAPLWFLATLAMCELCFFGFSKLVKKLSNTKKITVMSLIAVLSILIGFIMQMLKTELDLSTETMTKVGYFVFITFGRLFISLPSYIFGYILAKTKLIYKVGKTLSVIIGIVLIAGVSLIVIFSRMRTNCHLFITNQYWLFTLTALLGAIGIMMIAYTIEKLSLLGYLGQNSLGIMVLHYIPFKTINHSYNAVSPIWNNEIFISLAATVLVTAVTMGVIYLVKKKFFLFK